MTHACRLTAAYDDVLDGPPAPGDLERENQALRAEIDALQPLISASLLAATAFRLRDQDGLLEALRLLVRAVRTFEERTACA